MNRRQFLATLPAVPALSNPPQGRTRAETLGWFKQAKFGLFMHYGVYSLLGRGEWVQLREAIPVAEYAKLKDQFTAAKFDADFICSLAADAGMKYVNLTARHHDSFCLFRTKQTDFNSVNSPARRDLIGELANAAAKRNLGLFLYYSYGLDWRHPYFFSRAASPRWASARPDYKTPQPEYKFARDEDFKLYIAFVHAQIEELLTQYGPLCGLWLDPIMGYYSRPDLFPIEETYALIRRLQPATLICFKQGANGDEDFIAPERNRAAHRTGGEAGLRAWEKNKDKYGEICDTMQPGAWGYRKDDDGKHRTAEEVVRMLREANASNCNLLLNTGPLPDGSIHQDDARTLREVGTMLRG